MTDSPLLCVHRGEEGDPSMYWCHGDRDADGNITWSGDKRVLEGTSTCAEGPALAVWQGRIFCLWRSNDSAALDMAYWDQSKQSWVAMKAIDNAVAAVGTPALCVYKDQLFCVYQGDGTHGLYWVAFDKMTVEKDTITLHRVSGAAFQHGNGVCSSIRLVVHSDTLYCFHRGPQGRFDQVYWTKWTGENWLNDTDARTPTSTRVATSSGPGVASFGGQIFNTRRGPQGDEDLYTMRYTTNGADGVMTPVQQDYRTGNASNVGPTLVVCDGTLYCVYPGCEDAHVLRWTRWNSDNNTWLNDTAFSGNRSFSEVAVIAVGDLL